jgi:hypothetical protein
VIYTDDTSITFGDESVIDLTINEIKKKFDITITSEDFEHRAI